ncbi:MAG: matrixin family metalloprotease [archaeon]
MKIFKILIFFVLIVLLIGYLYLNVPHDPVSLEVTNKYEDYTINIDYGKTPVFMKNLRFNHDDISFFIEPTCPADRKNSMRKAFEIFHNQMKIISFYELTNEDADILVGCSDDYIKIGETHFAAGEGGPSEIINTTNFKIIEKGKISLYKKSSCDYPIVEIHELCHVFGFDHTDNPLSAMYPVTDCNQRLTPDMVEIINELYSIESLPDARIKDIVAVKKGKYLDFNISVINEGLIDIENISLTIFSEEEKIDEFSLGEIKIGYSRSLIVTNVKLPSNNIEFIEFYVDYENKVRELDKENNFVKMSVIG